VSQFALDGTFVGIFAGTGKEGSGDGEFGHPRGIAVLGSSGMSGGVTVAGFDNPAVNCLDAFVRCRADAEKVSVRPSPNSGMHRIARRC
jgi:hypothetical protein